MGLVGRNGAGKTTTIKSMLGLIRPSGGTISCFGMELSSHEAEIKKRIGYACGAVDYYKKKPASGTRRSTLYLRAAFGKMYEIVSDEQQQAAAIQLAANAPSYPQEGYIQKMDDIFVIKLSDYEN